MVCANWLAAPGRHRAQPLDRCSVRGAMGTVFRYRGRGFVEVTVMTLLCEPEYFPAAMRSLPYRAWNTATIGRWSVPPDLSRATLVPCLGAEF